MTLFTRTVFLDDTSILSKLDPGTWPERYGHIECRTSHDEIAQASEHFLSCRFDPDGLEAQLATIMHMASITTPTFAPLTSMFSLML
jgi:hypothetical protein